MSTTLILTWSGLCWDIFKDKKIEITVELGVPCSQAAMNGGGGGVLCVFLPPGQGQLVSKRTVS